MGFAAYFLDRDALSDALFRVQFAPILKVVDQQYRAGWIV